MATIHPATLSDARDTHSLNVLRLGITGGLTAGLIFVLCWLGTFVPFSSPTHGYITLFTNAEIRSGSALAQGSCWSLLFGFIVGAVFAFIYNLTAPLSRR